MDPNSPFYRWPKGTTLRASAELNVHGRRMLRSLAEPLLPLMLWLGRQPWVQAFARWSDRYWPRWFTFWNVMYAGVALYGALILFMAWRTA